VLTTNAAAHALTHSRTLIKQVKALKTKTVDILVATPGRLLHYLKQGEAGLDKPEQTVFVEDGTLLLLLLLFLLRLNT